MEVINSCKATSISYIDSNNDSNGNNNGRTIESKK